MDATLIEVLTAIVRKWKYHKRRLDRAENKKARFSLMNRANELELRVQNETSPMPRLMLSHELIVVDEAWAEVWDAEAYHQGALDAAVEWCAAHTGFGRDVVYSLAIAEFDTSGKPELKSEAQLLIAALLNLPTATWRTTGWAKLVLSAQPKSETSEHEAEVGVGSTPNLEPAEGNTTNIEPAYAFQPDGDGYFLRALGDKGHVTARGAIGLHDIFRLVRSDGGLVPLLELDAGTGTQRLSGDSHSKQVVANSQTRQEIAAKRKQLQADLADADSEMERTELQTELATLELGAAKLFGLGGKARDLNNPNDKLRAKIHGRIRDACDKLANCKPNSFPNIAEHFRLAIGSEGAFMKYSPDIPNLVWHTEPKM